MPFAERGQCPNFGAKNPGEEEKPGEREGRADFSWLRGFQIQTGALPERAAEAAGKIFEDFRSQKSAGLLIA